MNLKVERQGRQENLNVQYTTNKEVYGVDQEKNDISNVSNNKYTKSEIDKALTKLNHFLADDKTHAEYSIHEEFNRLMIKIVDDETDEIVLEIPPENIVDMVAKMCELAGILVDKKA
ncbi:MAG: flagellar protein FlaG [Clostridiales bacterium]|nr:flagellar protein FlaG [Clostridiales bacterium]